MANELDKTIEELEAEVLEEGILKKLNMGLNLKQMPLPLTQCKKQRKIQRMQT